MSIHRSIRIANKWNKSKQSKIYHTQTKHIQLTRFSYLFVLVGSDANELGFLEDVGPERAVGKLQDVVSPDQVKPRLVLVHRVQNCLLKTTQLVLLVV